MLEKEGIYQEKLNAYYMTNNNNNKKSFLISFVLVSPLSVLRDQRLSRQTYIIKIKVSKNTHMHAD